ncbi:MAG: GTP-binding protein [Thioalkalivibrio sp.]|nr:GTP-binding protein [Thioalkalivibrio sp.]
MSNPHAPFSRPRPIPAHLITGFLGVGKTTAIRRLLDRRRKNERGAVLVNEFGEVGVDGELLAGGEVAVRQVAGGCLCCVASQAFTVGLNHIIRQERPQRILIEPTGLGHPAQVIETLSGPLYTAVLEVRATITLMDARHLASARHRAHETWRDQIHLADVLVANKADLYSVQDREAFFAFARALDPPKLRTALVAYGDLDPAWLDLPLSAARRAIFPEAHAFPTAHWLPTSESGGPQSSAARHPEWWTAESRGEGHFGRSWRFGPPVRFDPTRLDEALRRHPWDRVKGVLATSAGWVSINRVAGVGKVELHPGAAEGRLEIIHHRPLDGDTLDRLLLAARRPVGP